MYLSLFHVLRITFLVFDIFPYFLVLSFLFLTLLIDANFKLKKVTAWFQANRLTLNVSKTKFMIFRSKNMHFDPENCKLKIGNEILERIGTDCTNKYFKFVGLIIDE